MIIREIFHGKITLNSMLLLLALTFVSRFRLELVSYLSSNGVTKRMPGVLLQPRTPSFPIGLVKTHIWLVYIPHSKYQAKSHSSPLYSTACTAAIVHRNHFFHCTIKIDLLHLLK